MLGHTPSTFTRVGFYLYVWNAKDPLSEVQCATRWLTMTDTSSRKSIKKPWRTAMTAKWESTRPTWCSGSGDGNGGLWYAGSGQKRRKTKQRENDFFFLFLHSQSRCLYTAGLVFPVTKALPDVWASTAKRVLVGCACVCHFDCDLHLQYSLLLIHRHIHSDACYTHMT